MISYKYKKKKKNICFFLVMRIFRIYSLSNLQIHHTAVLACHHVVYYIPNSYLSCNWKFVSSDSSHILSKHYFEQMKHICRSKHGSQCEILTLHQEFTGQIIFFNGRKSLNWWGGPTLNLQVAKVMLAKKWLKGHTQRAEQSWDGNVCPVPFPVPLPTSPMLCLPHPSTFRFKARNKTGSQRQRFPLQAKRYQNINKVIKTSKNCKVQQLCCRRETDHLTGMSGKQGKWEQEGLKGIFQKNQAMWNTGGVTKFYFMTWMVDTLVLVPICTFQYGYFSIKNFLKWHTREGSNQAEFLLGMNHTGHDVCKETLRPSVMSETWAQITHSPQLFPGDERQVLCEREKWDGQEAGGKHSVMCLGMTSPKPPPHPEGNTVSSWCCRGQLLPRQTNTLRLGLQPYTQLS